MTHSEPKPRKKWKLILPLAVLGACVGSCVLFFAYNLVRDMVAQYRIRAEAREFARAHRARECVSATQRRHAVCEANETGWAQRNCLVDEQFFLSYCLKYAPDRDSFCADLRDGSEGRLAASVQALCSRSPEELANDALPEF